MKDILVHVDGSARAQARIEIALDLMSRFGGRLTGLFAQSEEHRISAVARRSSEGLDQAADKAAAQFADLCRKRGVDGRWWRLPHGEPDFVVSELAFCARYFDLVILGQPEEGGSLVPEDMIEQVVLYCGRPALIVPYVWGHVALGRRILVAWNASPEVTRAVHDAMPLLAGADSVTVVSMRQAGVEVAQSVGYPPVDILDHLLSWGVAAVGEHLPNDHISKMDMLLSRAFDMGADLLVVGAHGHDGPSLLRNSATQHLLRHMTLPVLMAH